MLSRAGPARERRRLRSALTQVEWVFVETNRWAMIVALGAMAGIVFTNVVLRYLTNHSLVWAEEVARHLMIWLTFLGAGLVLRLGGHIAIDAIQAMLPGKVQIYSRAVVAGLLALCVTVMGYASMLYRDLMATQTTPATGISFGFIYEALPLGFALLLAHLAFIGRSYVLYGRFKSIPGMGSKP